MKIGPHEIQAGRTFILAEAGTNHLGRLQSAKAYVWEAAVAGCDGIKFQVFDYDTELFCPLEGDDKRWKRWNESVMPPSDWLEVKKAAESVGLALVFSVFQESALPLLKLCDGVKVASRAAPTFPYQKVWEMLGGCMFIVSQGLYTPDMPLNALVLQCVMKYPAPLKECLWNAGGGTGFLTDGISDHSGTPWPAIDACLRGAALVEVHFAIDKAHAGPDEKVCLTPEQLKLICEARNAVASM